MWIGLWWTKRIPIKICFYIQKCAMWQDFQQVKLRNPSDMFAKCRYMDELTDGHGIIFATGTPVSNSMTELFYHAALSAI